MIFMIFMKNLGMSIECLFNVFEKHMFWATLIDHSINVTDKNFSSSNVDPAILKNSDIVE